MRQCYSVLTSRRDLLRGLSWVWCAGGSDDGDAWGAQSSAAGRYASGGGDENDDDGIPLDQQLQSEDFEGQVRTWSVALSQGCVVAGCEVLPAVTCAVK